MTDLDYYDDTGEHAPPPPDVRGKIESVASAGRLTGSLFYATPRGARVVFLFNEPLFDPKVYDRAFLGAVVLGVLDLERASLLAREGERGRRVGGFFPDLAVRDLARFFFSPCATVDGITRDATVVVLRSDLCEVSTLAECADAFSSLPVSPKTDKSVLPELTRASSRPTFADAAARYNADHATDWGPAGGTCPTCGHRDCFGRSGPNPARWACFSANHEQDSNGCGVRGDGCWTGDVLDIHVHEAGLAPAALLRREGYLDDRTNGSEAASDVRLPVVHADAAPRKGIPFLDLEKIAAEGISPVPWIIEGWLARGDIVVFAGRAGAGKSTLAVDLAVAIASGREWCGIRPVDTGPVIYCDEEAGMVDISRQFLRHHALGLPNLHISTCVGLRLDDPLSIANLEYEIERHRPALVVLDSATQFFAGADENSATEMAKRFRPLIRLRETHRCSFLIVHHLRKPLPRGRADLLDMVRGSTAFTTQASTVWGLVRSAGGRAVDLSTEKRRGGGSERSLRIEYVEVGGHIGLRPIGAPAAKETQVSACSRFIVAHLQAAPNRRAETRDLVAAGKSAGRKERSVKKALAQLYKARAITRVEHGLYEFPRSGEGDHA